MRPYRIAFVVWMTIWAALFCRQFLLQPEWVRQFVELASADSDGRRAIAYGRDFYEFLRFCHATLPSRCTYRLIGPAEWSVDRVRAHYYLYPRLLSEKPDYILIYREPTYGEDHTSLLAVMNKENRILKAERIPVR